jgi:hypothetical protein
MHLNIYIYTQHMHKVSSKMFQHSLGETEEVLCICFAYKLVLNAYSHATWNIKTKYGRHLVKGPLQSVSRSNLSFVQM